LETTTLLYLIGALGLLIGAICGVIIMQMFPFSGGLRGHKLRRRLDSLEREHSDYQEKVSEHFDTTADLINSLTEAYRDIYQHMASGANNLCTNEPVQQRLNDAVLASNTLINKDIADASSYDTINSKDTNITQAPKDYVQPNSVESNDDVSTPK